MKSKILGSFSVNGNQLIVTDPCYPIECAEDEEFSWILTPVKRGEWIATVFYEEDETIAKLMALHKDSQQDNKWIETGKEIGVDSAMAGIFNASTYGRDEVITYEVENVYEIEMDEEGLKYYVACSDIVASDDEAGIVVGGAVSMSGIGDGHYPVFAKYNEKNEIVGVMLEFWAEEDE